MRQADDISQAIRKITLETFALNRSLEEIRHQLQVTRMLVLNLRFSSDKIDIGHTIYGTLVNELEGIARETGQVFEALAEDSVAMAQLVARTIQAKTRARLFYDALLDEHTDTRTRSRAWQKLFTSTLWERGGTVGEKRGRPEERSAGIEAALLRNRDHIITNLADIEALVSRLGRLVSKLNWVAIEPIRLISVSAQIETSDHHLARTKLPIITGNIRKLSQDMGAFGVVAARKITDLKQELGQMLRITKRAS